MATINKSYRYVDVIISSGQIKKLLFERCKQLQINIYSLCFKVGINPTAFRENYVKNQYPSALSSIPQDKFLNMLEIVGINVRVLVSIEDFEQVHKRISKDNSIQKKDGRRKIKKVTS